MLLRVAYGNHELETGFESRASTLSTVISDLFFSLSHETGCPDGWIFWAERCYFFSGDWKVLIALDNNLDRNISKKLLSYNRSKESTWNLAKLTCGSKANF